MRKIEVLEEPLLRFGLGQTSPDPKEGLFLFGPARDVLNPIRLKVGVIGTHIGLALFKSWVHRANRPISSGPETRTSIFYPGFRELFSCDWPSTPDIEVALTPSDISTRLRLEQRHEAVYETVGLFADAVARALREEEAAPDIWFVIVPDEVYQLARPKSYVPAADRIRSERLMTTKLARRLQREPSLFPQDNKAAEPYLFDLDFRNQLKARLVQIGVVTQIVRESTLAAGDAGTSTRRLQDAATVAWNLSVSTFYKAGGKPWRLASTRDGVCYVGLTFKLDVTGPTEENACCGAQLFLTTGEGMVFKGRLGPWYSSDTREFHLRSGAAEDIARGVANSYVERMGYAPKQIFIHGRTRFNDEEWSGFRRGAPEGTEIVAVRITRSDEFKLYRPGQMPVLRGAFARRSERLGYLWTTGFIPDLGTYPGWETPNPLRIELVRGEADLGAVAADVLNLTKLNFNACIYADGLPVTLRFADAVGEILTAAPDLPEAPLPFRHYI